MSSFGKRLNYFGSKLRHLQTFNQIIFLSLSISQKTFCTEWSSLYSIFSNINCKFFPLINGGNLNSIKCQDSNTRLLANESAPITTRPRLSLPSGFAARDVSIELEKCGLDQTFLIDIFLASQFSESMFSFLFFCCQKITNKFRVRSNKKFISSQSKIWNTWTHKSLEDEWQICLNLIRIIVKIYSVQTIFLSTSK